MSTLYLFFVLPLLLLDEPPALDAVDATLEALDGAAELALLDFTLSRALFCSGLRQSRLFASRNGPWLSVNLP